MSNQIPVCVECESPLDVHYNDVTGLPEATCQKCQAAYMERGVAARTVQRYVCAGCYGHLQQSFNAQLGNDLTLVWCPSCGVGRGFVTASFAKKKQSESQAEAWLARENLGDALGLNDTKPSEEDLLKGLGF
mgnify:FL=1